MAPAGFDWKLTVSLISGLAAKEAVVSSLSMIYGVSAESIPEGAQRGLRESLRTDPTMDPVTAYAFMVFVLLYIPCVATIVMVTRETGSWRWAGLMVVYTTLTAWVLATLINQVGHAIIG